MKKSELISLAAENLFYNKIACRYKLFKGGKMKQYGQFSKPWQELNFSDNYIFCKVMQNPELCKKLLEILLDFRIDKIEYSNTEQTLENNYNTRGIRMDVYVKDSNKIYDLEMQSGDYEDIL